MWQSDIEFQILYLPHEVEVFVTWQKRHSYRAFTPPIGGLHRCAGGGADINKILFVQYIDSQYYFQGSVGQDS